MKIPNQTWIHTTFVKTLPVLVFTALAACTSTAEKPENHISDANIAAIVVSANKIDISAAQIALERSADAEIREFATRMIDDHTGVLNAAVELVTRLGVTPADNKLVTTLGQQAANHEARLMQLSGSEFDKAYIDHEVSYHETVIEVIRDSLIPAAQNPELKETLQSVVPAFNAHLVHSKMVASRY